VFDSQHFLKNKVCTCLLSCLTHTQRDKEYMGCGKLTVSLILFETEHFISQYFHVVLIVPLFLSYFLSGQINRHVVLHSKGVDGV
jgi:hypothetical protein